MPEIEDELKLKNWLSVLTFDAFKYVKAGGQVVIEWTDDGLVLRLPDVHYESEGVNNKFRGLAEPQLLAGRREVEETAPEGLV